MLEEYLLKLYKNIDEKKLNKKRIQKYIKNNAIIINTFKNKIIQKGGSTLEYFINIKKIIDDMIPSNLIEIDDLKKCAPVFKSEGRYTIAGRSHDMPRFYKYWLLKEQSMVDNLKVLLYNDIVLTTIRPVDDIKDIHIIDPAIIGKEIINEYIKKFLLIINLMKLIQLIIEYTDVKDGPIQCKNYGEYKTIINEGEVTHTILVGGDEIIDPGFNFLGIDVDDINDEGIKSAIEKILLEITTFINNITQINNTKFNFFNVDQKELIYIQAYIH